MRVSAKRHSLDAKFSANLTPSLESSGLLGLRPARSAISCVNGWSTLIVACVEAPELFLAALRAGPGVCPDALRSAQAEITNTINNRSILICHILDVEAPTNQTPE